jgi:hypothetical protein
MRIASEERTPAGMHRTMLIFTSWTPDGTGMAQLAIDHDTEHPTYSEIHEAEAHVSAQNPGAGIVICINAFPLS